MNQTVSAQDRGFLFGDGVFDTLAVHDGVALFIEAHLARLQHHAALIDIVVDMAMIRAVIMGCVAQCAGPNSIIRTTITRGSGQRGLWPLGPFSPSLTCHATPLDRGLIGASHSLMLSPVARNETSLTSRIKSLGYLDHVLAAREAQLSGFDDALFLNTKGALACATIGNVFVVEGHNLLTPPLSDGALDGIMRGVLLAEPPQGLRVVEESLTLERALNADAMLITNSVRLARPVTRFQTRVFEPVSQHQAVLSHLQALSRAQLS